MKIKLLVGALVLLLIVNISAVVMFVIVNQRQSHLMASWPMAGRMDRAGRMPGDLSVEERHKLLTAMSDFHQETHGLMEKTRALEDDVITSMSEDPVPRAHIDSLLQQISDNRLELARRATDRMIKMGRSLTPQEREHIMRAIVRYRGGGPPADRPGRGRNRR